MKLLLEIDTVNDAMMSDPNGEVERIFTRIMERIRLEGIGCLIGGMPIRDTNGNTVGRAMFDPEADDEEWDEDPDDEEGRFGA